MAKRTVETYLHIKLSPVSAREAMMRIMDKIGRGDPPFDQLSFTVDLRDLNIPLDGQVRVNVREDVQKRPLRWESSLTIEAAKSQQFFPKFRGTLTVTPSTNNEAELWLQGSYEPPLGAIGAGLNATIMRGAAERSLQRFLDWIGTAIYNDAMDTERQRMNEVRSSHGF